MNLKKICLGSALLIFSISVIYSVSVYAKAAPLRSMPAGSDFCITNLSEYNAKKASMPAFLQTTPVLLGADKKVMVFFNVVAALRLSFRGNVMTIASDIWHPKDKARYTDLIEIAKVCFYNARKELVVQGTNGSFNKFGFTQRTLVSAEGIALSPVTPAAHQALVGKISTNAGGRPGRPAPVGVRN